MTRRERTADDVASPEAVTDLILRIFRLNGRLLLAGDQLVEPLGLTSARWQVLGAIAAADRPRPVVRLARDMGVSRQAVQRIANDLARAGLVAFKANPHHQRAQLVEFTDRGRSSYEKAMMVQRPWVTGLATGLTSVHVKTASDVLDLMLDRLDRRRVSAEDADQIEHISGPHAGRQRTPIEGVENEKVSTLTKRPAPGPRACHPPRPT